MDCVFFSFINKFIKLIRQQDAMLLPAFKNGQMSKPRKMSKL